MLRGRPRANRSARVRAEQSSDAASDTAAFHRGRDFYRRKSLFCFATRTEPVCRKNLRESYFIPGTRQAIRYSIRCSGSFCTDARRQSRKPCAAGDKNKRGVLVSIEFGKMRVAFQGEAGAFSEAAAVQLLGEKITTVPRPTFDATFRAISDGLADALLVPVENSLAGSVVRVYDLLLESNLVIVAETILRIEHQLIGCPGASVGDIRSVSSHPVALAQCERFFLSHLDLKLVAAEDAAGRVREVLARGVKD